MIQLDASGSEEVKVIVDSDWTRKRSNEATNAGCMMIGEICMKEQRRMHHGGVTLEQWRSRARQLVRVMAGHAEMTLWPAAKASLKVLTDNSTCKGMFQRTRLGKTRHIDVAPGLPAPQCLHQSRNGK